MAFKMNKPVIEGTKEHSALLATASEMAVEAASGYGKSMIPDTIDYDIKLAKIEFDKKKEEEEDPPPPPPKPGEKKKEADKYDIEMDPKQMSTDYSADVPGENLTPIDIQKRNYERDYDTATQKLETQIKNDEKNKNDK